MMETTRAGIGRAVGSLLILGGAVALFTAATNGVFFLTDDSQEYFAQRGPIKALGTAYVAIGIAFVRALVNTQSNGWSRRYVSTFGLVIVLGIAIGLTAWLGLAWWTCIAAAAVYSSVVVQDWTNTRP